ncbi:hypothetical protein Tco_0253670 [Tanacetum coccineum]
MQHLTTVWSLRTNVGISSGIDLRVPMFLDKLKLVIKMKSTPTERLRVRRHDTSLSWTREMYYELCSVLPSFEVYTPPVTYLEEVEETIGILMEVDVTTMT